MDVSTRLANIKTDSGDGVGGSGPAWLRIGIKGFSQYTAFPLHLCVAVQPATSTSNNRDNNTSTTLTTGNTIIGNSVTAPLVMHVHTFDQPLGQKQNPDLIKGLSRHLVYHRCALHIDHYEVTPLRLFTNNTPDTLICCSPLHDHYGTGLRITPLPPSPSPIPLNFRWWCRTSTWPST